MIQRGSEKVEPKVNRKTGGDGPDLEEMIDKYGSQLYRMCFMYLGEKYLAEDALQDTFLKAFQHLGEFRGESSEKTWLTRIAINVCKNYNRIAWFRHVDFTVELDKINTACESHTGDDTVICEVMKLPEKYKVVILLFYYQQMNISEIASSLSLAEGTVSTRLRRGRERLKRALKGWYFDE